MTKSKKPRAAARRRSRPRPSTARGTLAAFRAGSSNKPVATEAGFGITVVGVGASAGGLEAVIELLESLPRNPGVALVLVQHLAPNHDIALPVLLAPHTTMRLVEVTNGIKVEPDHVYVIPPNTQMELVDGGLHLSPRPKDRTQHTPIDTFFSSLARMDGRSIAVVLSGTASDGALGVRDVKAAGGITFAQQPESAKYDGMPKAAIATGMVDMVLTASEIGAEIAQIAAHPYVRTVRPRQDEVDVPEDQLKRIFDLLRPVSGVDFRHYKVPTIRRRLLRRMALHRLTEVEQYITILQSNPVELRGLFQDLLIHVTRFFREPESFDALAADVFPKLLEERGADQPLRVWVCGCATGEEAYSLAIALVEFLQKHQSDIRVQIFATDVSDSAIEHARAGVYSASIAADVGPERLRRFFTRTDGNYRVSRMIRDLCVFARQDLTKDPPFSRLDLVMCRNVLIYMDSVLQKRLIALFHYALNPHGYLVLGQAETVGAQASLFGLIDKKHRVHRKKSSASALPSVAFPVDYVSSVLPRKRAGSDITGGDKGLQGEVSRAILDRYAPSGVVVDQDLQIVQFRGQTGTFLEPAPGEASLSLLKMTREGLLYGLRTALHSARKSKQPIRKEGLQVRIGNTWRPVTVEVIPLTAMGRPHYLVLFEERGRSVEGLAPPVKGQVKGGKPARPQRIDDSRVTLLQRELAASREYLQSIIQELEAANEELQSANEEILSSNEELQSTNEELDTAKEELQSTNEELNTVNEELHGRNEELSRVNSDLMNLVGSVQIAIVIVSSDLRIRRFTPMAEKVLNLIPADLDRSIGHINPNIESPNLEQLIIECMDTVAPIEREVRDRQGHWYSLRIRPYKSLENKIDGAVLALIDVDALKQSERRGEMERELAEAVLQATSQPTAVLTADLNVRLVNGAFASLLSLSQEQVRGRLLSELGGPAWKLDGWSGARRPGDELPEIVIPRDRAGRWTGELRVRGRIMPSPENESSMVLVSVVEAAAPARGR
jgi:two-component system CheB/CheR fusion protein